MPSPDFVLSPQKVSQKHHRSMTLRNRQSQCEDPLEGFSGLIIYEEPLKLSEEEVEPHTPSPRECQLQNFGPRPKSNDTIYLYRPRGIGLLLSNKFLRLVC